MAATRSVFRVGEFAKLAGVTVRALHHYDRIGLLRPRRGDGGYRVYTARDLEALEQIVVLKFVGPIKGAVTEDPAGARAQTFADRWTALLGQLMGQPVDEKMLAGRQTSQAWEPRMASFVDKFDGRPLAGLQLVRVDAEGLQGLVG